MRRPRGKTCRNSRTKSGVGPFYFACYGLPYGGDGAERPRRGAAESEGPMIDWFKKNAPIVWSWAALIAVAAIVFAATRGSGLAQFGIGLLSAAIALLVAMGIFELIWQAAMKWLDTTDDKGAPGSARKHRQRGQ